MTRTHLFWALGAAVVAGIYLGLRAQMGNFISIFGLDITPVMLGEIGAVFLLGSLSYVVRKRLSIGGRGLLSSWLWPHIYLGALGLMFIWFHSRQRFSANAWLPNAAMIILIFIVATGLLGRLLYVLVPRLLGRLASYDPPAVLQSRLVGLEREAAALVSFKSNNFQAVYGQLYRHPPAVSPAAAGVPLLEPQRASLPAEEHLDFDRLAEVLYQRGLLQRTLARRRRYRRALDLWWLVHVRLTELGAILATLHILEAIFISRRLM